MISEHSEQLVRNSRSEKGNPQSSLSEQRSFPIVVFGYREPESEQPCADIQGADRGGFPHSLVRKCPGCGTPLLGTFALCAECATVRVNDWKASR